MFGRGLVALVLGFIATSSVLAQGYNVLPMNQFGQPDIFNQDRGYRVENRGSYTTVTPLNQFGQPDVFNQQGGYQIDNSSGRAMPMNQFGQPDVFNQQRGWTIGR